MNKWLNKIIWIVVAIPAVYLAIVWNQLPEKVAMHFNMQGNVDRYGSKRELLGMTAIIIATSLFIYFLLTNIYRIDPKRHAAENKDRLRRIAFAVAVFMSALLTVIIYNSISGSVKMSMGLLFAGVGLLFAIIGNYMSNLKPNYFAGFRLPWTLENEDNWKRTHILAGRLWFAGGLLLAIVCLFLPMIPAIVVFFTVMTIITIIPIVYSYRLYKKQKASA